MVSECHMSLYDFLYFLIVFLRFLIFEKMSTLQFNDMPCVIVNILYSMWSLYSLFLFNLDPI